MSIKFDFTTYDVKAKRAYLLDVFVWVRNIYPIYMTIYTYLYTNESPPTDILDDLYIKLHQIWKDMREWQVVENYNGVLHTIERIKMQEQQDSWYENISIWQMLAKMQ